MFEHVSGRLRLGIGHGEGGSLWVREGRGLGLRSRCPQVNRFKYVHVWSHGNNTCEQID